MPVTLKDIAERTGVSASVVSTVLSGRDNGTFVSDGTRRKVLQVAEMLHYTPVRTGRPRGSKRLRRQHAEHFVGVWAPDYDSHSAYLIQHLQAALSKHVQDTEAEDDYSLRLLTPENLPRLDVLGLMGMVLISSDPLPREAAGAGIPCVMIGETDQPVRDLVQVHLDSSDAGCLLGEYLWSLGHRRVALLAPEGTPRINALRLNGLRSVWTAHEADGDEVTHLASDGMKTLGERESIRRVLQDVFASTPDRPTALVCAEENTAATAAQALAEIGLGVPRDVSLACFGDTPRLAEALTPPLTAVRAPAARLAAAAVAVLYQQREDATAKPKDEADAAPLDRAFSGQLIVRASCAPPPEPARA